MKKSLIALAVLAASGVAHAQSSVTIYGMIDLGLSKKTGSTTAMQNGDNSRLGFRGEEDLGNGLKALYQMEMRLDADTGTAEAGGARPIFQGQSRVGLKGDFGMIRLGRGLTAVQEMAGQFEPWGEARTRGFLTSHITANYNGDPLNAGSSQNRWSNAIWYNTPGNLNGFALNATIGTKEQAGSTANPYSFAGGYAQGPVSVMLGYERNQVETKFWNIGGSYKATPELKLMAHYSRQNQGATRKDVVCGTGMCRDSITSAWLMGLNYSLPTGTVNFGFGQINPDLSDKTKRIGIGYEHTMSKRTFLYIDVYNEKVGAHYAQNAVTKVWSSTGTKSVNQIDFGINHRF